MRLRPRSSGPQGPENSLRFPLGPPDPDRAEEVLVDWLNRRDFPVMTLAAMDDLLAQALMSTKKQTATHRMTLLARVVDKPMDNGVLLQLCRMFGSWLRAAPGIDRDTAFEEVCKFVSWNMLVKEVEMDCFK